MTTSPLLSIMFAIVMGVVCIPTIVTLIGANDYVGCVMVAIGGIFGGLIVVPWIGWQILNLFNRLFDILEKKKRREQ